MTKHRRGNPTYGGFCKRWYPNMGWFLLGKNQSFEMDDLVVPLQKGNPHMNQPNHMKHTFMCKLYGSSSEVLLGQFWSSSLGNPTGFCQNMWSKTCITRSAGCVSLQMWMLESYLDDLSQWHGALRWVDGLKPPTGKDGFSSLRLELLTETSGFVW